MVEQINTGSFILSVYVSWSALNFNGKMALYLKIATYPYLGQNRVITFYSTRKTSWMILSSYKIV